MRVRALMRDVASRRPPGEGAWRGELSRRRPVQMVVLSFLAGIVVGTGLLLLPVATAGPRSGLLDALFTAVSAVCVTGLVVVDTPTYWSGFGHVVILALIQLGGFGFMTMASLLGLMISRHLGLQSRMVAAASTRSVRLGDVRSVLIGVLRATVFFEAATALVLAARFVVGYGEPIHRAVWLGLFHAVSAFNNAGFALYSDSLMGFVTDPWVCLPISFAVIAGGLGFPVLFELYRHRRGPRRWSLHTRVTMLMTAVLLPLGTAFVLSAEWGNSRTLGPLDVPGKVLAAFVQSVMPRTAGFNTIDTSAMNTGTWLGTDVLMFIGGGSAGTAGGIKITTFAVLAFAIWSELRGDPEVTAFDRRIATPTQRQALAVALLSVALVTLPTIAIAMTSPFTLDQIVFEVVSAFATVGLSTGITTELSGPHQVILIMLMFIGRLGPITLGSALALRPRERVFRKPEGTAIIG